MDQITEGLLCNLYENDDDRYFILKVTDIENDKYALVAPIIANTNPLRYDDSKMFCIKIQGENGFETVKDKNVIRTLVELWSN